MTSPPTVPQGTLWQQIRAGTANLGAYLGAMGQPNLRLGVTGLSRAGKTVFITGLVHALVAGGRLPAFALMAEGRLAGARIVEHPDDSLPRFAYEDHLAMLTAPDRAWPDSTRQISALSLELDYQSRRRYLGGLIGPAGWIGGGLSRLGLDIVDYPGEWLLDLPLLAKSYREFSAETLVRAAIGRRAAPFAGFLAALTEIAPETPPSEPEIRRLAEGFAAALRACRAEGRDLSALAPGRFLMPGDLEGAPALTFAPLRLPEAGSAPPGSLWALMERRYEAYKARIVRPFFTDHFSRIDRQIVLVDVLGALNGGAEALADLESALADILAAFRVGANSLLSSLFAPRIDRILFAVTKADHLHHRNHDRLEAILRLIVRRAQHRARGAGVASESLALAAIRATREVTARENGAMLPCVAGIPIAGETLDGLLFDGRREAALFPGDLPERAETVFANPPPLRFLRFRPPLPPEGEPGLPHIRLDRALEFLIGDLVA
ncbi:YcjX family protein [Rhabdaerophilum calidifontis]|uniref:YcjX family protein n=1 Tax=Rhabdaerophilum calidifontis TaxID=2604328 RepID=UPI001FE74FA1|nr:YcjX family protein [Rhabdaerophilum calidifontis]